MGFANIDDARIAGLLAENEDFATDAAIKPLKIAKRPFYIRIPLRAVLTGGASSAPSGTFAAVSISNAAGGGTLTTTLIAPRGEVVSGDTALLYIWWTSSVTTGNARFIVDLRPITSGATALTSAITRAIISPARGVANTMQLAEIVLPQNIFANGQIMGLTLTRNHDNTFDTLNGTINIKNLTLVMQGRC